MAKKGFKPVNGFDKNPARASLAGRISSNALPPELKEARAMNANKVEETLYKYMSSPLETLQAVMKDPTTPAMDLVVIKILTEAIKTGDHARLNFLLDRTIGKVADKTLISAQVGVMSLHDMIIKEIEDADK